MASEDRADRTNLYSLLMRFAERVYDETGLYHAESSEHLDEYQQILSYLSGKGSNHRDYRHYATRDRVRSILDGSAIYLTDGSNWNDKSDRKRFNPQASGYKRFGVCLSSSTEESVAMWMLYGGTDGNGAMINFDKGTLQRAMSAESYEFGQFVNGVFEPQLTLPAMDVRFALMEVLYYKRRDKSDDEVVVMRSMGNDRQVQLPLDVLGRIDEITKYSSWSYEQEVRLVAVVDKLSLGIQGSDIKCVRVPLDLSEDFISQRVYNSPVSDGKTMYRASELQGTVEWDLCGNCVLKKSEGVAS